MLKKAMQAMFGSPAQQQKQLTEAAQVERAEASQQALITAASTTLLLAEDITTQLRNKLDDYQAQLASTSNILPDALIITTDDGTIETFNRAAENIFGFKSRHIVGQNLVTLFRLDDVDLEYEILVQAFSEETRFDPTQQALSSSIKGFHRSGHYFSPSVKLSQFTRSDDSVRHVYLIEDVTEKRAAEEQFIALSNRQSSMLNALPDVLATFDADNRYTSFWCPPNFGRAFDFDNPVGQTVDEVFAPEYAVQLIAHLDEVRTSQGIVNWDYMVTRDGQINHYEARSMLCNNEVLMLIRNTTALVSARQELVESEAQFKAFGLASSEAMMVHNPANIVDWNPRLSELTGYTSQEIANMLPLDFIHPLERDRISPFLNDNTPRAYETLLLTKAGVSLEVAVNSKPIEWKNSNARIKVIQDITHFKDFDDLLKISRERYRSITENTIDLVVYYDVDGELLFANQTYWDYFGIEEPLAGEHFILDIIHSEDALKFEANLKKLTQENPVRRTLHRVLRNDQVRWVDWIDRAVYSTDGVLVEYHSVGRDVTDYVERQKIVRLTL